MDFRKIQFGKAAAEKEKSDYPHLLIEGFLNIHGYFDQILTGDKFLVLGPKGSGKSAIGAKLELDSNKTENVGKVFVKQQYLTSFPFEPFSKIIQSNESFETKLPIHWEYLLLISLMDLFLKDPNCKNRESDLFKQNIQCLKNLGVLPNKDFREIISKSTDKNWKVGLGDYVSYNSANKIEEKPFSIEMILSSLREICYSISTTSKHLLIIDGLDDTLDPKSDQFTALSSLILATERMNSLFRTKCIDVKVVILCRTDLYDKLPGTNTTKTKRDSAIILNWYQDQTNIHSTHLVELINLRARLSLGKEVDVFKDFFPEYLPPYDRRKTINYIFDHTRHTPRDIIQLLNEIQLHCTDKIVTKDAIFEGIKSYSQDYFVPEIRNQLNGFLSVSDIDNTIRLLSSNGSITFEYGKIEEKKYSDKRFATLDLDKILNLLFDCNAIGNDIFENGRRRVTFKFRNPHASFDPTQKIMIHKGLIKGLNL